MAVGECELSAAQVRVIAAWADEGPKLCRLRVRTERPRFVSDWRTGDLVLEQGDAYRHVSGCGVVRAAVPPVALAGA